MADPTPVNTPLPDVPLTDDPEVTAYLQSLSDALNPIILAQGAPSLVTGLTATANSATIVLRWNAANNASLYRVYRNTMGDFDSAQVIQTVGASKTGIASLSTQDAQDQTQAQRFYWVQAVNQTGLIGPQSQMVVVTNFTAASGSSALGPNANASGSNSTALGVQAAASGTSSTALGDSAEASNTDAIAIGKDSVASGVSSLAIGDTTGAISASAIAIGKDAGATNTDAIALGVDAIASGVQGIAIGTDSTASNDYSIALGTFATTDADNQLMKGGTAGHGGNIGYFDQEATTFGPNGERFTVGCLRESTAYLNGNVHVDTAIQIPQYAVVFGVGMGVDTPLTSPVASISIGTASNATLYGTGIPNSAGTNYPGTNPGPLFYGTATSIRITPDVTPTTLGQGRIDIAIFYYQISPPLS